MLNKLDKVSISLYCIVLLLASFTNDSMEINILSIKISPETITQVFLIIHLLFFFFLFFKFKDVTLSLKQVLLGLCVISIISFSIIDLLFHQNINAIYELNFILLLSFIPLSLLIVKKAPKFFEVFIYIIILIIILQITFFQNNFDASWDTVRNQGEVISRLSILGYVSSTLAIILSMFLVFIFNRILNKFNLIDLILFGILFFSLLQTFSRTGLLVSFMGITFLIFYKNLYLGVIWSLSFLIIIFLSFSFIAASDQGLILKFLDSDFGSNNPRILYAIEALSRLEFYFQFLFGNGFFIMPTDNTLIGLISGRGIIGFLFYLVLLASVFTLPSQVENKGLFYALMIVILLSALTIDMFGQRKIIYFFGLLLSLSLAQASDKKLYLRKSKSPSTSLSE